MGRPSVCPCEPSGLSFLGKDYGFASDNSFLLCKTAIRMGEIVGKESQTGHREKEFFYLEKL